jgi:hypothetical protein
MYKLNNIYPIDGRYYTFEGVKVEEYVGNCKL